MYKVLFKFRKVIGFFAYDFLENKEWLITPGLSSKWINIEKIEYIGEFKSNRMRIYEEGKKKYSEFKDMHDSGYYVFSHIKKNIRIHIPKLAFKEVKFYISKGIRRKIPREYILNESR